MSEVTPTALQATNWFERTVPSVHVPEENIRFAGHTGLIVNTEDGYLYFENQQIKNWHLT